MVRQPFVADRFYPGSPEKLRALLQSKVPTTVSVRPEALGALVPHAGYVYSGGVAGEVYARLEVPSTVLLLGTNHTGMGSPFSLSQIDPRFSCLLLDFCEIFGIYFSKIKIFIQSVKTKETTFVNKVNKTI